VTRMDQPVIPADVMGAAITPRRRGCRVERKA
jgi:hypothetical protein